MATTTISGAKTVGRERFYANSALFMLFATVASFTFTYHLPLLAGSGHWPLVIHLHAIAYFGWMALYAWQSHLVAAGRVALHRELGLAGIALSALMVPLGISVSIFGALKRQGRGDPLPFASTLFNVIDLLLFAALVAAAIACVTRHREWHRRFMFGAALCLLGPALSRWFIPLPPYPPFTDFGPSLIADLLLIPLALNDRKQSGRVHPATWLLIAVLVPIHFLTPWGLESGWWNNIAPAILSLRV